VSYLRDSDVERSLASLQHELVLGAVVMTILAFVFAGPLGFLSIFVWWVILKTNADYSRGYRGR
jgi:hypothetical protein